MPRRRLRRCRASHAVDLAAAVELARILDRLPPVAVVYGVEGARFSAGAGLSEEVARALDALVDAVRGEARALRAAP
jgi:hydrogenase maturation protease